MSTRRFQIVPTCLLVGLTACGGGSGGGPSGPSGPNYSVTATVFYDQNANGQLDGNEAVRLPQVEVVVGSASGRSAAGTGQAVVSGVAPGAQQVAIRTESLPVFFVPASPIPVQVPESTGEVRFPVMLPIGANNPNVYLAFGDSLTSGEGSSDGNGYRMRLQSLLAGHLGRAEVVSNTRDGTFSSQGAERIPGRLNFYKPAYNLILYGTNDWNDQSCQNSPPASCFTIDSLRTIVAETRLFRVLPVLGTLPPVNPARNASRNVYIDQMNVLIKNLAREQGALVADLNAEFKAQGGDLSRYFVDDVHMNDSGYDVMARAWLKYLTQPRSAATSSVPGGVGSP
jgi:lysophospholipase L1-like esterase